MAGHAAPVRAAVAVASALAAMLLLAACVDAPAPTGPADGVDVAGATAARAATPVAPEVTLDVGDPGAARALEARLADAGFTVTGDAPTRVTGRAAPSGGRAVAITPFALIVHPRAPLVDLTLSEAEAILRAGGDGERELLVAEAARDWLDRTYPVPNRFARVAPAGEIVAEVAERPDAVGLVPADALGLSVRALTVGGHDPYRDPRAESPLQAALTVTGPEAGGVRDALEDRTAPLDPAGFLATGELIPARCTQERVASHERGFDVIFDGTRELIGAADLAMSHWEPSIVDATPTPCVATFNMSVTPDAATAARRAGIDVALAVGNHLGDCWTGCSYTSAVRQTLAHLRAAGMTAVGAGDDLEEAREHGLVTVDGVTFAFLAYDDIAYAHYGAGEDTPGTAHTDAPALAEDVRRAAAEADHVIVGFSWGIEYVAEPSARQQELAHAAIDAGASLVVGNHPHWVQATEATEAGGFIAYGLGNFIFDQDWSVETTQGAILEVGFTAERILGVRLRPTAIRQQHLVELLDPTDGEGAAILDRIWRATDAIAR